MADIDIHAEPLLSLAQAARTFPKVDGKRPCPSTVWRWCREGVKGINLAYVRIGRRLCTTPSACSQFANELAEADQDDQIGNRPPRHTSADTSRRQREIEAAEAELTRAGI